MPTYHGLVFVDVATKVVVGIDPMGRIWGAAAVMPDGQMIYPHYPGVSCMTMLRLTMRAQSLSALLPSSATVFAVKRTVMCSAVFTV